MGLKSIFGSLGKAVQRPFKDVNKAVRKVGGGVNKFMPPGIKRNPQLLAKKTQGAALAAQVPTAKSIDPNEPVEQKNRRRPFMPSRM